MKLLARIVMALMLVAFALPLANSPVAANKRVYKAELLTTNEIHTVVGSEARGHLILGTNQDGSLVFEMKVTGLSGPVTGAHFHAPANEAQNAGVKITLCGNGPVTAPAIIATCTTVDGVLEIQGDITAAVMQNSGLRASEFFSWLNSGLVYVNVHTALNPAGETRGQVYRQ